MKTLLLLAIILTSCGTGPTAGSGDQVPNSAPSAIPTKTKDEGQEAKLVQTEADRSECKKKNDLIYVVDIKQFQSCDGAGNWVKVNIDVNQTVTNVTNTTQQITNNSYVSYPGANIYEDSNGVQYYYLRAVQKKRIDKSCADGFHPATKAEIETVTAMPAYNFWTAQQAIYNQSVLGRIWAYDAGNLILGSLGGSGSAPSTTWQITVWWTSSFQSIGGYNEDANGIVCVK